MDSIAGVFEPIGGATTRIVLVKLWQARRLALRDRFVMLPFAHMHYMATARCIILAHARLIPRLKEFALVKTKDEVAK